MKFTPAFTEGIIKTNTNNIAKNINNRFLTLTPPLFYPKNSLGAESSKCNIHSCVFGNIHLQMKSNNDVASLELVQPMVVLEFLELFE